jgi:large conductance mechanosensitive channel
VSNLVKEFRDFINRGNVIDLAVAVVLATAFAPVVAAIVTGLITPIVAAIFGQPDFTGLSIEIGDAEILYGLILEAILTFATIAFAVFLFVVKPWNAYQRRAHPAVENEEVPPTEAELLAEIRDLLRQRT